MLEGGCLCGAVRYRLSGASQRVTHCHCAMCRKQHGAAFATYARVDRSALEISETGGALSAYRSSGKVLRQFCRTCGSSLFWSRDDAPQRVAVAVGTLDGEPDRRPDAHIFVESKAAWTHVGDGLPQYAFSATTPSEPVRIAPTTALSDDFATLEALASGEDFGALQRLREEWASGANRFALAGEVLLEARIGEQLAGICGLNRDPYMADSTVGRLRHLYVHPELRRRGIGRLLVATLLGRAFPTFTRVRLRTRSADADRFYLAIGLLRTEGESDATHTTP